MAQRSRKKPESPLVRMVMARITGSEQDVRRFLSEYPLEPETASRDDKEVVLEVVVPESVLTKAKERGLKTQTLYDASARGRERQKEVGKGNRFEGEHRVPKGLGVKTKEDGRELP